jgi:hypothetical protein
MTHHILCIPRVGLTVSEKDIYNTLNEINMIKINSIKFIFKSRKPFATVLIYFNDFLENENGQFAKKLITSGKDIKIIHDFPWFWKITLFNNKLTKSNSIHL